jgi:TRAP-type C4-dicarboxylate transport system substrate-binding protein
VWLLASAAVAYGETAIPDNPTTTELQALAADMKPFTMRGIGGAIGTSEWLFMEVPFWTEILPKLSGDKITVQLTSQTALNLKGSEVFSLTSQGIVDFSEIAANYGAGDLPQLDGMDLAGVAASFEEQNAVLEAYLPIVSKGLADRFGLVTAGYANSTAQVFFCNAEITDINSLVGKKVRLTSSTMADLVKGIGAAPVTMSFAEMVPAMQRGVIDCAITGTMSGNTAKLYEVGTHMYTLTVGWAPRLAFFNGNFWNGLDETQQAFLTKAINFYFRDFADPIIEKNNDEGIWCTTGDDRCTLDGQLGVTKTSGMKLVTPSEEDIAKLKEVVGKYVLPSFAKGCGEACATNWNDTVGAVTGLTAAP